MSLDMCKEPLLPDDWQKVPLSTLGEFFRGRGGTRADEVASGLPCIRYGDLYTHHDCIVRSFCSFISPSSAQAYTPLQSGDVVFAASGETFEDIGKAAAYCDSSQAYAGADTIIFRPIHSLNPAFAGYAFNGSEANQHKARMGQGSSVIHISAEHLSRFVVKIPSLPEQARIAEILETIDEAIGQTEILIAKMKKIKTGLLHRLLTQGVTEDGLTRPPCGEAPHLYKESPIGSIPREWQCAPCSALTEMITVGIVVRPTQYYVEEGVPAFRSANIREDGIDPSDLVFISPQSNAQLAKSQVRPGDVLSVRTGYPGTSAVVPSEYTGANCIDILISRPSKQLRPDYLAAWINSPFGKEQVLRKQGGLAQQHFNVAELRDLLVAVPGLQEQDEIVARILAINEKIAQERVQARKYKCLRLGLMDDLLSGCVQIPIADSGEVMANV